MPLSSSGSSRVLSNWLMVYASRSVPGADVSPGQDPLDENPDDGHRDQHLPAQPHDLVIAIAGKGGAEPQEQEQEQESLEEQPAEARGRQDGGPQHRPAVKRTQPPAH